MFAAADPKPGEYAELAHEAHRLQSAEQVRAAARTGYSLLYEAEPSARDLLARVAKTLEPLAQAASELADASATLERLADETREVAFLLRDLGRDWEDDPARLEDIEERMASYRRLASRFRCGPDELADRRAQTEAQADGSRPRRSPPARTRCAAGRGMGNGQKSSRPAHRRTP